MTYGRVFLTFGWLTVGLAVLALSPLAAAIVAGYPVLASAFLATVMLSAFVGGALIFAFRGSRQPGGIKETILLALVGWTGLSLFAAVPWLAGPTEMSLADAWFEAVSATTTTAASAFAAGSLPVPLVLWQALLAWAGGFATIVFAAVALTALAWPEVPLHVAPMPWAEKRSLIGRLKPMAQLLLPTYVAITFVGFLSVWAAGAPAFDALIYALCALATAGFQPAEGAAAQGALWPQAVIFALMCLGTLNIMLHFGALRGRVSGYWRDLETRYFVAVVFVGAVIGLIAFMGGDAYRSAEDFWAILWADVFDTISLVSTTGYLAAAGAEGQPPLTLAIALTFIGGSAISTAGGLKLLRGILLTLQTRREIARLAHPHGVARVRYKDATVPGRALANTHIQFIAMLLTIAGLGLIVALDGHGFEMALTAALAALSNAGPILQIAVGTGTGYDAISSGTRLVLGFAMIAGRIEILALLALAVPGYWRR